MQLKGINKYFFDILSNNINTWFTISTNWKCNQGTNRHVISTGVFMFQGFLNTSIPEILKSKNLCNESLNKLPKNYYFKILALKYLKKPETQTALT